jgi:integrase
MSIYRRGKVWWYKFWFNGQPIRESSKSTSKTIAKDAERARRRELERAYNRIPKRISIPLFRRAADEWLSAVKPHLADRTQNIYDVAIRCHLKPVFGLLLLCDIEASRISAYQARRKAEGASARTLNKELQVLRQILKRYKLWANLQGDVKFERESDHIGKALSDEDENRLLAACGSNLLLRTVVTLALNTALRKNEIRKLRWEDIDLLGRTLTVGRTKTEGGSGRRVPLNSGAYGALVRWAGRFPQTEPESYVFPACEDARLDGSKPNGAKIDASRPIKSWRTAWRRAIRLVECPNCRQLQNPGKTCHNEDCGADIHKITSTIAGLRFHDLRHTCITKVAEGPTGEQTLMSIAGHLSRKMLEHYSHIRMAAKRAALDAIASPVRVSSRAQNWAQSPTDEKTAVAI